MLTQTIKTITANIAPPTEPLVKMLDKSVRLRLKTMSHRFSFRPDFEQEHHDNFLKGYLQTMICLRRAKKANQLGLYYWYRSQEETRENFRMEDVHNGFNKLHGYLLLMKKEPELCGGMEFLDTEVPHQFESFSSFVAGSLKEKVVDTYFISRQQRLSLQGKQVESVHSIECPNCGYAGLASPSLNSATMHQPMPGVYVEADVLEQVETNNSYTRTIETHTFNAKISGVRRISQDDFARFAPPAEKQTDRHQEYIELCGEVYQSRFSEELLLSIPDNEFLNLEIIPCIEITGPISGAMAGATPVVVPITSPDAQYAVAKSQAKAAKQSRVAKPLKDAQKNRKEGKQSAPKRGKSLTRKPLRSSRRS